MHSELLHIEYRSRRTELEIAKRSKKTRISHAVKAGLAQGRALPWIGQFCCDV